MRKQDYPYFRIQYEFLLVYKFILFLLYLETEGHLLQQASYELVVMYVSPVMASTRFLDKLQLMNFRQLPLTISKT